MSNPTNVRSRSPPRSWNAGYGLVPLMLPEMVESRDRVAHSLSSQSPSPPGSPALPYETDPLAPSPTLSATTASSEPSFVPSSSRAPLATSCPCGLCDNQNVHKRGSIQASIQEHQKLLQSNKFMDQRINRALMWTEDLIAEGKKALANNMAMIATAASIGDDPASGYSLPPQDAQSTTISNGAHGLSNSNLEPEGEDIIRTQDSQLQRRRRRITMASRIPVPIYPATPMPYERAGCTEDDPEAQDHLDRLSNISIGTRLMFSTRNTDRIP
ncbi:hypothetical protein MMC13_004919 [Lambiella insularis]|nr:hypothetical protein [Lambiella insularis]